MECGGAPAAGVMEQRRARATRQRLAEVELPRMGITVGAVHVPPDGDPTREAVFQEAVETARRRRGEAFVLMGDFNAGRHRLDEAGATFTCTRLLGTLAAMGYVDAWRRLHPEGREYTWFSHEGGGFRIDHCFLSAGLSARLSACRYSHKEREMGLSDHSMLVVDLE
jgi:exonuclease III